jgi:hypothetical protein
MELKSNSPILAFFFSFAKARFLLVRPSIRLGGLRDRTRCIANKLQRPSIRLGGLRDRYNLSNPANRNGAPVPKPLTEHFCCLSTLSSPKDVPKGAVP